MLMFMFMILATCSTHAAFGTDIHNMLLKWYPKRTVTIQAQGNFSSIKGMAGMMAEIAMDNLDKKLGFDMVPPVALQSLVHEDGTQGFTVHSLWVEPASVAIHSSSQLREFITPLEWMQMNIFWFLVGQYDRHFGNLVLSRTGKLFLIDNEGVANIAQKTEAYSEDKNRSCAWIPLVYKIESSDSKDTRSFEQIVAEQPTPEEIELMLSVAQAADQWTQLDIRGGYCRMYNHQLWRQMYARSQNLDAPFSHFITTELLKELQALDEKVLSSVWAPLPYKAGEQDTAAYEKLVQKFVQSTLQRRDMIVAYFVEHPEAVL